MFGLFNIGKSAIFASQAALDVTANNIANVNTPNYSRKEAILDIQNPEKTRAGYIGRGVTVRHIRRYYDGFLENQILLQKQNLGRANILGDIYGAVEEVFNEQQSGKFSERLNNYINSWHEVASNPAESPQRTVLIQNAQAMIITAKGMERSLKDTLSTRADEIVDTVDKINAIADDLAALNKLISTVEAGSSDQANDLRDKRGQLLNELSELTSFTRFEDDFGRVTVVIGGKNVVDGERVHYLSTEEQKDGSIDVLYGKERINDYITGGKLAGLITGYDQILSGPLKEFRRLVASIVKETNLQHRQGYDLNGNTNQDFFSPLTVSNLDYSAGTSVTSAVVTDPSLLTLDEYEIRFTGPGSYEVYNIDQDTLVASGAYTPGGTISFDGIDVVIDNTGGGPLRGDKFLISPLIGAIENLSLAVTSPDQIAAAEDPSGLPGHRGDSRIKPVKSGTVKVTYATLVKIHHGK
ncbi:MAG: flagellar hook-associated protein FlgK, partial [Nitrospirae bacterium]